MSYRIILGFMRLYIPSENEYFHSSATSKTFPEEFDYGLSLLIAAFKNLVMTRFLPGWYGTTKSSVKRSIPKLILSFESMVENPTGHAEKLARFIMGDSLDEADLQERLLCLKMSSSGGFKRPKRSLNFEPYDKDMKIAINDKIALLASVLRESGLTDVPNYSRILD